MNSVQKLKHMLKKTYNKFHCAGRRYAAPLAKALYVLSMKISRNEYYWVVFFGVLLMLPIQFISMFEPEIWPEGYIGTLVLVAISGFSFMCFIVIMIEISSKFGKFVAFGYFILIAFPLLNVVFYLAYWSSRMNEISVDVNNDI